MAGPSADADAPQPTPFDAGSEPDEPSSTNAKSPPDAGRSAEPEPQAVAPEQVQLEASDGGVVHARYFDVTPEGQRPLALLFHQAGANGSEYDPIAPRLQALGVAALAIDQRSGGQRFGRANHTVDARQGSTGFSAAYPDLEGALAWARAKGHGPILAMGSSYTAALVFRLRADHCDELAAVLAFSPGEYLGGGGKVAGWAARCDGPVFLTSAPGKEVEAAKALADVLGESATQFVPKRGVHGASTLRADRNAKGHEAVWSEVEAFVRGVVE